MTGSQIRRIRKRLGWTQEQLAEKMGVTANTVARWERDEMSISEPAAKLIRRLAMVKTQKAVEVKLKDGRILVFEEITDISATDHRLKLYSGTEVVADFDRIDVSSWFAPDRVVDGE